MAGYSTVDEDEQTSGERTVTLTRRDIEQAAARLRDRIAPTPVLRSAVLDQIAGTSLYLKAEHLQPGGSYKLRGAMHAVGRAARERHVRNVITQSAGNHAIAVGLAARQHGISATVVLSATTSEIKTAKCRATGARIIVGQRWQPPSEGVPYLRTAEEIVDVADQDVITGLGTASLELISQTEHVGVFLDALAVPVGGGSGVAGACLAAEGSGIEVYGIEPWGGDGLAQSLAAGQPVLIRPALTMADGLNPAGPGPLAYQIASTRIAGTTTVTDDSLRHAILLAYWHLKIVLEPAGAAALAAALDGNFLSHRRVGIVLTGGNAESSLIAQLTNDPRDDFVMARPADRRTGPKPMAEPTCDY